MAGVLLGTLALSVSGGLAQAAPMAKGKPGKPAKTQVVFTCSYVCPEDGVSPCAWAVRAETRPLPQPVQPK